MIIFQVKLFCYFRLLATVLVLFTLFLLSISKAAVLIILTEQICMLWISGICLILKQSHENRYLWWNFSNSDCHRLAIHTEDLDKAIKKFACGLTVRKYGGGGRAGREENSGKVTGHVKFMTILPMVWGS